MDKYEQLLNKLYEYFTMPDIETSDNVISAFSLYNIINDKFEELKKVRFAKEFVDMINKENYNRRNNIFQKKKIVTDKFCSDICSLIYDDKIKLMFSFSKTPNLVYNVHPKICKDLNSDELYFEDWEESMEFIKKYYDLIMNMFNTLEEFIDLFNGNFKNVSGTQKFSDSFLDFTLIYDSYGRVSASININKEADLDNISDRKWYNKERIRDIIKDNKETLLKKIPIDITELDDVCQRIITKEKQLIKF